MLLQVGSLIFSMDFVVLYTDPHLEDQFILVHPLMDTQWAYINVVVGHLTMREHAKVEVFDVHRVLKFPFISIVLSTIIVVDLTMES